MLRYTVYYIYGNFNMHESIKDLLLNMNLHQADTKAMVTRQDKENKNYVGLIFTKIIMNWLYFNWIESITYNLNARKSDQ